MAEIKMKAIKEKLKFCHHLFTLLNIRRNLKEYSNFFFNTMKGHSDFCVPWTKVIQVFF